MIVEATRVLVVDDEVRFAQSLACGLRAQGFDVDLAHAGITGRDTALRGAGPTTSWCWTSCCPLRTRARRGRPAILQAGDLTLDPGRHRVCHGGTEISLTAREFAVLHHLLRNPDVVLSKSAILKAVRDGAFDGVVNIVEVYIG